MNRWLILVGDSFGQGIGWTTGIVLTLWVLDRLGANVPMLL